MTLNRTHPVADVERYAEPLGDLGQSLWGMNISSPTDHFLYITILASFLVRPGAPGRIRTCDTRFRKPMLYPLSYEGLRRHPSW